jgi:hypothetical protein
MGWGALSPKLNDGKVEDLQLVVVEFSCSRTDSVERLSWLSRIKSEKHTNPKLSSPFVLDIKSLGRPKLLFGVAIIPVHIEDESLKQKLLIAQSRFCHRDHVFERCHLFRDSDSESDDHNNFIPLATPCPAQPPLHPHAWIISQIQVRKARRVPILQGGIGES